jgi:tripartite ATP-independent transporter DctP family solute receptor
MKYTKSLIVILFIAMFFTTIFLFSASAFAKDITIKLAHPNVPAHPMGQAFIKFKKIVENKSNGNIKVIIYDSGKFGDDAAITQAVESGILQMGSSSTPNLVPFSNKFALFDMPFLFKCYKATDRITDGEIGKNIASSLKSHGIIGLGYIDIGFRELFNSKRPIKNLSDAKGLKIRSTASKVQIATLRALGMNPTSISWSEVYTALQQGTVDGVAIDLNLAWFNKFQEVNKYLTLSNIIYSPHLVMINKRFYNSLNSNQRKIIKSAFEKIKPYERRLIRGNEKWILKKMKKDGVKVTKLGPKEKAKWVKAVQPVYTKFSNIVGKDLIKKAREEMSGACTQ